MQASAARRARRTRPRGSTAAPAARARAAATPIRARGQGDDNRTTYWCPGCQALRRVGHKGADLIAPGNTPRASTPRSRHGVDMIEFDVLPDRATAERAAAARARLRGRRRAHAAHARGGARPPRRRAFAGVELDVDLKLPGYEERVVEALRERGLVERALISTQYMRSLVTRARGSSRGCGSAGRSRASGATTRRRALTPLPAYAALALRAPPAARRRGRPHRRAGRCDAVMAHWRLVTPALVEAVHGAGGELYVWTVDDAAQIAQLEALGVDGVITNDPRLFAQLPIWQVAALSSPPGPRRRSSGGRPRCSSRARRDRRARRDPPAEAHHAAQRDPRARRARTRSSSPTRPSRAPVPIRPPARVGVAHGASSGRRRGRGTGRGSASTCAARLRRPASRRGCRSRPDGAAVSQTLTVAQGRSASAPRRAARRRPRGRSSEDERCASARIEDTSNTGISCCDGCCDAS